MDTGAVWGICCCVGWAPDSTIAVCLPVVDVLAVELKRSSETITAFDRSEEKSSKFKSERS
jgi:hypothetical protein